MTSKAKLTHHLHGHRERGILDEIAIVLNRRRDWGVVSDNCIDCQALRRKTFRCAACGYVGVPVVSGCTCVPQHRSDVRAYREMRARMLAGETGGGSITLPKLDQHLALMEALTPRRCSVEEPGCGHGIMQCPVCIDGGSCGGDWALTIIRELRALLRSVGVAA